MRDEIHEILTTAGVRDEDISKYTNKIMSVFRTQINTLYEQKVLLARIGKLMYPSIYWAVYDELKKELK